ncbi:hypothetical protein HMPREF1544_04195 [Mucor circinelloides 1006PhL]|uniref:Attractin/MKLN-like beta-propeller domain-containing protein n=1 Tax=Mucor circinelloides f. circinelloides (strain 1006PhL) TaxID=1220926 RepID=S2K9J9_MUCC1|nr:hypothetical protein HMPREF1544_04195 [Mucor circinelloides 1006PhL]
MNLECGLLVDAIYCYGGLLVNNVIDSSLYSLPLTNFPNNKSMINLAKTWNLINYTNTEYVLEGRRRANSAVYNSNSLFVTGGYTYNGTMITNQTIVYNRDANTWQTLNTYVDTSSNSIRQIYNAAAVNLAPIENTIALYGGVTENPIVNTTIPIQTDSSNQTVMHEGYSSIVSFNYGSNQWLPRSPQTNIPATLYSAQTVTFNPKTGLIYYLGGFYYTSPDYTKENKQDFKSANVFDTSSGSWSSLSLKGANPAPRMFPTATLLPNSNDILLFGGTNTGQSTPFTDFCYTLNLDTNNWTHQSIDTVGVASAPRFAHSAILVNTTLFIMFGLAVYNNPLNDILVMSVNDVNNLYFPDTYPYIEQIKTIPSSNGSVSTENAISNSSSLSTGAVAGIAVACIVVGLGAIVAAAFFCIRKKRADKKKLDELSVDWDEVEHFYNNGGNANGQNMVENGRYFAVDEQAAVRESIVLSSPSIAIEKYTPNEYDDENFTKESTTVASEMTPNLGEESVKLMKPSVVEGNDTKIVETAAPPVVKQKPDISTGKNCAIENSDN